MPSLHAEAPAFALEGVQSGRLGRFTLAEHRRRWVILFFYPADFTFVCPTEVRAFQKRLPEVTAMDAVVLAIGPDDVATHREWARELGGIDFPLLSDRERDVARAYEVLDEREGRPYRATFVIAPDGRIAWLSVSPMNVGRSVEETLRVVQALQTGRLCPADWRPGEATGGPELRY
ncbi:MAG TPA: peroxiredoxin [Vicinamibacteria bacterium]|nr:peroxiredoxin [Vicinamibacteria bacterium]